MQDDAGLGGRAVTTKQWDRARSTDVDESLDAEFKEKQERPVCGWRGKFYDLKAKGS